jgi:FlaA1/EpsC-like NDP-sugar epimerase
MRGNPRLETLPYRSPAQLLLHARITCGRILKAILTHRFTQHLLDGLCGVMAIVLAYSLRFDFNVPVKERLLMWSWAQLLFIATPLALSALGEYRATWGCFGLRDLLRLTYRASSLNLTLLLAHLLTPPAHNVIPGGVVIIDFGLLIFLTGGIRSLRRFDREASRRLSGKERVLIVGTESTIVGAIRQLHPLYGAGLIGVVTENTSARRMEILGVPMLGDPTDLGRLMVIHQISLIFLCSADLERIPEVIQVAADFDVPVKFLPSAQDLIDNRVRVSRNLTAASLRVHPKQELHPAVAGCFANRTILVTGAGGSIGSELVRQAAALDIKKLIILDQDENSIFELQGELAKLDRVSPVIGDICDRDSIRCLFDRERPDIVLHAAAYKHVPMMELNACEAVLNNVCGTRILAEAAADFGAERMVMISSDKAVRPSSVMGATKRVAEVLIQSRASSSAVARSETKFACVRFGNVLGSRGSILPVFLKQIAQGGPLTVTHEDMTRYFMTIPQACRLVMQAATLASCGDVYMLDMGDPIRIMSFAREIIRCSGLTPGKDISIEIVGARPGEKLHERLWAEEAHVTSTEFDNVFRVQAEPTDPSFHALLENLEIAAREHLSEEVRALLKDLRIDYLAEGVDSPALVLSRV